MMKQQNYEVKKLYFTQNIPKVEEMIQKKQYQNAHQKLDQMIKNIGQKSGLKKLKFKLYMMQNKYDEALKISRKIKDSKDKNYMYDKYIAKLHQNIKDKNQFFQVNLSQKQQLLIKGDHYFLQKKYQFANIKYNQYYKLAQNQLQKQIGLARRAAVLLRYQQYLEAIELLNIAIQKNKNKSQLYGQRGYAYFKLNNNDKAMQDLKQAWKLDNKNNIININYACTLLLKEMDTKKLLQILKGIDRKSTQLDVFLNILNIYQIKNNFEAAQAQCKIHKEKFSNQIQFQIKQALIKFKCKNKSEEGLQLIKKLCVKYPNSNQIKLMYAKAILLKSKTIQEIHTIKKILITMQQSVLKQNYIFQGEFYNTLGWVSSKLNNLNNSIKYYSQAVKISKLDQNYRFNLCVLYLRQRLINQAKFQLNVGKKLKGQSKKFEDLQQKIQSMNKYHIGKDIANKSNM